jgi:hypothetical protein
MTMYISGYYSGNTWDQRIYSDDGTPDKTLIRPENEYCQCCFGGDYYDL